MKNPDGASPPVDDVCDRSLASLGHAVDMPFPLEYRSGVALVDVVVLSAVQGAAEVLPISATGHAAAARLWLDPERSAVALEGVLHFSTAAALSLSVRSRLAAMLGEGVRAIARPALFRTSPSAQDALLIVAGSAVSLLVAHLVRPYVELWANAPIAHGLGLICTGMALATVVFTPTWRRPGEAPLKVTEGPPLAGMIAAGLVHGLAIAPGASRVGAALVLLLWLGVRPARAMKLAFLISVPALIASGIQGAGALRDAEIGADLIVAGLLIAFLGGWIAALAMRELIERRRVALLALWVLPLGLAMLAYARAL